MLRRSAQTLVFEWGDKGIAWDPKGTHWLVKGRAPTSFKDLQAVVTPFPGEKGRPNSPGRCEKLVDKLLASSGFSKSVTKEAWPGKKSALNQAVHDFRVALWKLGVPRETKIFDLDHGTAFHLEPVWVKAMPAWATAQLKEEADPLAFDRWLKETQPHRSLTDALIRGLSRPGTALEIVGPPGAGKTGICRDLMDHFESSPALRPVFIQRAYPLAEFFAQVARRFSKIYGASFTSVDDDPGHIAQGLRGIDGPSPLLILSSVSEYFGPQLEDAGHCLLVKHWLAGLQTLRKLGDVSILLAGTVAIDHQAVEYDDLSVALFLETFSTCPGQWDEWITEIRGRWDAAMPSLPQQWGDLSARVHRQAGALVRFLQSARNTHEQPPLSTIDDSLAYSAKEIVNRLPLCCKKELKALLAGQADGSSACLNALAKAGILIEEENRRFVPMVPAWAESWSERFRR